MPSSSRVSINGTSLGFSVNAGETLLKAAARQGIAMPSLCNVGECGSCRCQLTHGHVSLKKDVSHHISYDQLRQGQILACQSLVTSDIELSIPTLSPHESTILSADRLSENVIELKLKLSTPIRYQPGQFALLTVPSVSVLAQDSRSYSFADGCNGGGAVTEITFHIRHLPGGTFTDWLFKGDVIGTTVIFEGPHGSFTLRPMEKPPLFIASGTGFAPVKAVMEQCLSDFDRNTLDGTTLIYGARTLKDIYCIKDITTLQQCWPGELVFIPALSRSSDRTGWSGCEGYAQDALLSPALDLIDRDIYLCGPPLMIDGCMAVLDHKIDSNRVVYDKFLDRRHMVDSNA